MLADNNTLICWCGEQGVRLCAYGTGGTHSAARLLRQAEAWADPVEADLQKRTVLAFRTVWIDTRTSRSGAAPKSTRPPRG